MVSHVYKKHLKIIEFPTIEGKRIESTSNFKALPTGWKLLKYFSREVFRKD